MKLLLTSAGLRNDSLVKALQNLAQKPFGHLNLAFIPTAANLEGRDKKWLIRNLAEMEKLQFPIIDIVDISALPKTVWLPRLQAADILMMSGGNTYYLMNWVKKSGLDKELPELLKTRVYIGISAGSMITNPSILPWQSEKDALTAIGEEAHDEALGLVDFMIEPHINSPHFPELTFEYVEKEAQTTDKPVYGIDDQTAVQVIDKEITVISEGEWKRFN
jgi:dipeptidase E